MTTVNAATAIRSGLLKQLKRLLTGADQNHHAQAMGIETGLFPHQIGTGQGHATGFDEENRKRSLMATHSLKVESLTNSLLCLLRPQPLDKRRPEMVHLVKEEKSRRESVIKSGWQLSQSVDDHLGRHIDALKGISVIEIGIEGGKSLDMRLDLCRGAGAIPITIIRLNGDISLKRFFEITTITDALALPDRFKNSDMAWSRAGSTRTVQHNRVSGPGGSGRGRKTCTALLIQVSNMFSLGVIKLLIIQSVVIELIEELINPLFGILEEPGAC